MDSFLQCPLPCYPIGSLYNFRQPLLSELQLPQIKKSSPNRQLMKSLPVLGFYKSTIRRVFFLLKMIFFFKWILTYLNYSFNSSVYFLFKVAIVAQDLAAFHTASSEMGHQQHSHHLVTTETRPLTLVATSNGTQIAVQVSTVAAALQRQQHYLYLSTMYTALYA